MTNPGDNAYNGTVRVEVVNHADMWAKPRYVRKSTWHTYVMDPSNNIGPNQVQICGYEPDRIRTVFRVYDSPLALCMEKPNVTPDAAISPLLAPQGYLLLPNNGLAAYEFFGPDAMWINTIALNLPQTTNLPTTTTVVGASGADAITVVPGNQLWQLEAVDATLVTSATAGNRTPSLIIDNGAGAVEWQSPAQAAQAASLTVSYSFGVGNAAPLSLPSIELGGNWRIRTSTAGILAGDVWTVVSTYTQISTGASGRISVLREYC